MCLGMRWLEQGLRRCIYNFLASISGGFRVGEDGKLFNWLYHIYCQKVHKEEPARKAARFGQSSKIGGMGQKFRKKNTAWEKKEGRGFVMTPWGADSV